MSDGELPIPAGVVYLSSHMVKQTLNDYSVTDEEIIDNARDSIQRSGVVLEDDSVLHAMSHSASKEILVGVEQKDGKYVGKALMSGEQFEDLYEQIYKTLTEIGEGIYSGHAAPEPFYPISTDPCGYCDYSQICRKNTVGRRK